MSSDIEPTEGQPEKLPEGLSPENNRPENSQQPFDQPVTGSPENVPPIAVQPLPQKDSRFWGAWATIGFGVVAFIGNSMAQVIVMFIFGIIMAIDQYSSNVTIDPMQLTESLASNGLMLSVAVIFSAIVGMGLVILFIYLRKGISIREYLALKPISFKTVLAMIGVIILLLGISIGIESLVKPTETTNMITDAYENTRWPALFWIAIVIFAPVFEESLFRGFLFAGLQKSPIGPIGAIILTGAGFASLHALQYDISGVAVVLVLGIVFGIVRWKTGSLWATITLHGLWNLLQMVMLTLYLNGAV